METLALYPGSFDPITYGHLNILQRGLKVFSSVHLVIVHNPRKSSLFSIQERLEMARTATKELPGVEASSLDSGLLVDYAKSLGATSILKGFRTSADLDYELPMAHMNRELSGLETVFLPADPNYAFVSSSLVKEVSVLFGDVSKYVPPFVSQALSERLGK